MKRISLFLLALLLLYSASLAEEGNEMAVIFG